MLCIKYYPKLFIRINHLIITTLQNRLLSLLSRYANQSYREISRPRLQLERYTPNLDSKLPLLTATQQKILIACSTDDSEGPYFLNQHSVEARDIILDLRKAFALLKLS